MPFAALRNEIVVVVVVVVVIALPITSGGIPLHPELESPSRVSSSGYEKSTAQSRPRLT